jgi:hypothetical protein
MTGEKERIPARPALTGVGLLLLASAVYIMTAKLGEPPD